MIALADNRLTNSQLTTAATCLRKHQWAYVAGIRPASESQSLRFGSAWHRALHRRAGGMPIDANLAMVAGEYELAAADGGMAHEAALLRTMLALYDWRWSEMDAQMRTVASESSFEVPLVNPETGRSSRTFVFAGQMDRLHHLPDGRLAVGESKTTSDDIAPESSYWKRLRVDTQIARYVLAARHLGHQVDTVLYDVVRKPTLRPLRATPLEARKLTKDGRLYANQRENDETPDEYAARVHAAVSAEPDAYFARREIPRTDADLADAARDLWDQAQVLHQCDREGRWPRNSSACVGFGVCPYLDLCSTNRTPDDEGVPEGFIRLTDTHRELAP